MSTQYTTQEILKSSIENINTLKNHLVKIDELRIDIKKSVDEAEKLPEEFNKIVVKIDNSTNKFIQQNQNLLKEQIVYFQEKLIDLTIRINQIDELDFTKKFELSKNVFFSDIEGSSNKLENSIQKIDNNFNESKKLFFSDLEKIKSELDATVKEIKSVDLEKHFIKHDKTLSEIFISINNISSSILSFSNQLNTFLTKLIDIENKLISLDNSLSSLDHKIESRINSLDQNIINLNAKIEELSKKNQTSHTINLALIIIILVTIAILKFI